jgi:hypothetical protein
MKVDIQEQKWLVLINQVRFDLALFVSGTASA